MTAGFFNLYQQITSVRLSAANNVTGTYFNGPLNNGIDSTLTSSTDGTLSVDGVVAQLNDRVLLIAQNDPSQNGIFFVLDPGSSETPWVLQRAEDFQSIEQIKAGQFISVNAGLQRAGSVFIVVEPIPSTIGGASFNFVSVADTGGVIGPYLLKSANLSDVNNTETSLANLGLGSGQRLILTNSDFPGGIHTLSNPPPNFVTLLCTNPGNTLRLPPAQGSDAFSLSQGVTVETFIGFQPVTVTDSIGTFITLMNITRCVSFTLSDKSTPQGTWNIFDLTEGLQPISGNSLSGRISLTSNDGTVSIVNSNGTLDFSALAIADTTPISQQLWVNTANGIDSVARTGDINSPFASYTYALSIAVASASPTNQYLIHIIGDQTLSGNFVISPFVNVDGHNSGLITANTFLTLDTSWTSANNEIVFIKNCNFAASDGASLNFGSGLENLLYFDYCSFDGVPTLIATANNSNSSPNDVLFQNTIFTSGSGPFQSGTAAQDALLLFKNCPINNLSVICTGSGGTFGAGAVLQNCTVSGTTQIIDSGTGASAFLALQSSPPSSAPSLSGSNAFLQSDVASYTFIPTFSGTPLTNVSISSLSDGLLQTSYTPVNFTPDNTGGNYLVDSMTAMIHGIDNALAIAAIKDAFSAYASSAQNNVTGAGAVYTVQFDTQAGGPSPNYNTGTGIYTAPADGFYQFSAGVNVFNLDVGMTALKLSLLLNGTQIYVIAGNNPFVGKDASGDYTATGAVTVPMSAGDTANITLEIDGGLGNNAGIYSSTNPIFTFFTGSQL